MNDNTRQARYRTLLRRSAWQTHRVGSVPPSLTRFRMIGLHDVDSIVGTLSRLAVVTGSVIVRRSVGTLPPIGGGVEERGPHTSTQRHHLRTQTPAGCSERVRVCRRTPRSLAQVVKGSCGTLTSVAFFKIAKTICVMTTGFWWQNLNSDVTKTPHLLRCGEVAHFLAKSQEKSSGSTVLACLVCNPQRVGDIWGQFMALGPYREQDHASVRVEGIHSPLKGA
eukprot:1187053-Prorocentrum_minimum.AAC.1